MSVQSEINRITTAVSSAYSSVTAKGGTLPASQTVGNLATAISSIPSGGLALNVVAYATAAIRDAATPSDNTIGIVSSTAVNGYMFSSTAPTTGLVDGIVWVKTGTESTTPIPADSNGSVILYPVAAEQYQSGVWVSVDAKCYQNGIWSYWYKKLYTDGTKDVAWTAVQYCTFSSSYMKLNASATKNRGCACTTNAIDLTAYNTLKIEYRGSNGYPGITFGYHKEMAESGDVGSFNGYSSVSSTTLAVFSLDISAVSGSYYIKAINDSLSSTGTKTAYIYRIWLEG